MFSKKFCAKSPFKVNNPNIEEKLKLKTSNKPRFKSTYSISGESGSQSGITIPKNPITNASGDFSYGTSKRNVNIGGGVHLPTGTGSLTVSGKTNIGKRTNISGSITASSGQKPLYNIGITYDFGRRKNKKKKRG